MNDAPPLLSDWPEDGPPRLWQRELGDGFSTVVASGNTVYTMYRNDKDEEVVAALNAKTGETKWEYSYDAPYLETEVPAEEGDDNVQSMTDPTTGETTKPNVKTMKQTTQFGKGPNSTPLLVGNRLYTIGFTNKLHCFNAQTGKVLWDMDLYNDGWGSFIYFGYSASPVAYKDMIIVLAGGKGHAVVALDQKTGAVRWQSGDMDASYSSPVLVKVDGKDHLVVYGAGELVGMSPDTGEIQWSLTHTNEFNTSICTPVAYRDNMLFVVNGGDEAGGLAIRLKNEGEKVSYEEVWKNRKLQGGLNNPVRIGDTFYGPGGGRKPFLVAFNANTGEIEWQQRELPKVKGLAVGKDLLLLDENGNLIYATPGDDSLDIHAQAKISDELTWSTPTLVGDTLYVRDRKNIAAYDLGTPKSNGA